MVTGAVGKAHATYRASEVNDVEQERLPSPKQNNTTAQDQDNAQVSEKESLSGDMVGTEIVAYIHLCSLERPDPEHIISLEQELVEEVHSTPLRPLQTILLLLIVGVTTRSEAVV